MEQQNVQLELEASAEHYQEYDDNPSDAEAVPEEEDEAMEPEDVWDVVTKVQVRTALTIHKLEGTA